MPKTFNPFFGISCNTILDGSIGPYRIPKHTTLWWGRNTIRGLHAFECIDKSFFVIQTIIFLLFSELQYAYKKAHSHFYAPWDYLVCFKDSKLRQRWYKTAAEFEIELHERFHRTKSGKPTLLSFDAPTMVSYQVPSKACETVECRKENAPPECQYEYHGFDPELFDPTSQNIAYSEQKFFDSVYSPIAERHMREIILKSNSSEWQNKSSFRKNPFQS